MKKKLNKQQLRSKYIYKIGDFVLVSAKVIFYNDSTGAWIRKNEQIFRTCKRKEFKVKESCQIVGAKHLFIGEIISGCSGFDGDGEQGYLSNPKSVFVWEIKRGLLNKTEYALPEDIWIDLNLKIKPLPNIHQDKYVWKEKDRLELRKQMKDVKRDKKGRWLKEVYNVAL